jgi:hypothetical protein
MSIKILKPTKKEQKTKLSRNDEFDHLRTIVKSLNSLTKEERVRTLHYLKSKYNTDWPTENTY